MCCFVAIDELVTKMARKLVVSKNSIAYSIPYRYNAVRGCVKWWYFIVCVCVRACVNLHIRNPHHEYTEALCDSKQTWLLSYHLSLCWLVPVEICSLSLSFSLLSLSLPLPSVSQILTVVLLSTRQSVFRCLRGRPHTATACRHLLLLFSLLSFFSQSGPRSDNTAQSQSGHT